MDARTAAACPPLVLTDGGPGDGLLRRLRLAPAQTHARRAALVLAGVAWLPLCVLAVVQGLAVRGATIPFFYDIAAHVRFLVALPVLLVAEIPIGARMRQVAAHFIEAGLVRDDEQGKFAQIIAGAVRMRDSRVAELVVLAAAYVTTYGMLTGELVQGDTMWYQPDPRAGLTAVGFWYVFVSLPIFQFILYRWGYRMLVWARFLRRVSQLDLQLTPMHPDGAGGLGFLGKGSIPFGVLLFAVSAIVSSRIATHVLFAGAKLRDFQVPYAAIFVLALVIFAGPLLIFVPTLFALKQRGFREYGALASRYTQLFDRKWLRAGAADESILGSGDIQSLADLGNSFELVRKVRPIPIELGDFVAMVLPGVIPAIPLAATVMPVSDILKAALRLIA